MALVCGLALGAVVALAIVLPLHLSNGPAFLVGIICGVFGVVVATVTLTR